MKRNREGGNPLAVKDSFKYFEGGSRDPSGLRVWPREHIRTLDAEARGRELLRPHPLLPAYEMLTGPAFADLTTDRLSSNEAERYW